MRFQAVSIPATIDFQYQPTYKNNLGQDRFTGQYLQVLLVIYSGVCYFYYL
jgi:hypothetical protein